MNIAMFLHPGKRKCPKCGVIGAKAEEENMKFFKCPLCSTEFTDELILNQGDDIELGNN